MADQLDLPDNPTIEDIEKELIFRNIMLDALDHEADDYIQRRADAEEKIETLNRMLGIDNETLSQGGLSQDMLSPIDVMSPGAMSQGTMSQESWEQMTLQPFEDPGNQFGEHQFGHTDLNGMGTTNTNGGGNEFAWMMDSMWEGECSLFFDNTAS
jgi:hypothetical protein